ncbi:MAG: MCE family protein, partial [Bacteroidaceae bacterium]|nr:MCE family protein [Bacteroidaceae bacterium]
QMVPKLDSILSSLQLILSDKSIPSTLHSVEKTTKNLAQISSKMKALMYNDIPGITGKLNIIGDNLVTISDSLKGIDYKGTMMKIDQTISNVKLITEKINSKDNTLGLLLSDDGLYNHLNTSAEDASKLLEDLKAHPKRYVHFSVFGKKEKSPAAK